MEGAGDAAEQEDGGGEEDGAGNPLWMHPDDGARLGLTAGATATIGCSAGGVIGGGQGVESVSAGIGEPLAGRLLMLDGRRMQWSEIALQRDPECSVCGG